jgi:hypothetical protein
MLLSNASETPRRNPSLGQHHPSGTLHLSSFTRKQLSCRLQQAYASGSLKLIKRIHALLALAQDQSVSDVAEMLALGEQTISPYRGWQR